ncbi:MAG: MerR family transcriptional regulator [Bacteroidota bacterium]
MYTIGQVAKKFSISRSTLIYYDSIGLLSPSGRSNANYRLYSDSDILKMGKISQFRKTGLPLESIASILEKDGNKICGTLENRLFEINEDIRKLRYQQNVIVQLLKNKRVTKNTRIMTKNRWVSLLRATGLNDYDMERWHVEFERMSPEAHQDFLESLGIQEEEIKSIRKLASNG